MLRPLRSYPLRNGRMHYLSGYGECPNCRRVICTRRRHDGASILVAHRSTRSVQDRQLARQAAHYELNSVAFGAYDFSPYIGLYTNSTSISLANISSGFDYVRTGTNGWTLDETSWANWNITYTITATTNNSDFSWERWANPAYDYVQARVRRSPEAPRLELEYRQREAEQLFRRAESEMRIDPAATARAQQMLLAMLTEEQRAEYAEHGYFHVVGSKGGLYRILRGSAGNIRRVLSKDERGRGQAGFCVHLAPRTPPDAARELGLQPGHLPHEDHMLVQLMHLQADEEAILNQANVHWGTRWPSEAEPREVALVS